MSGDDPMPRRDVEASVALVRRDILVKLEMF
jgi:hypothetical protein